MSELAIQEEEGGVTFTVKVVPGSSRTAVSGVLNGMLKVKVAAVAEKGKANKGLIEFLAEQLGVKKKLHQHNQRPDQSGQNGSHRRN